MNKKAKEPEGERRNGPTGGTGAFRSMKFLPAWPQTLPLVLAFTMHFLPLRRAGAEERVDFKTMYYSEGGDRMKIWEPGILWEHELTPTLTITVQGVYNMISGSSPTGAPPSASAGTRASASAPAVSAPSVRTPSSSGEENDFVLSRRAVSGAPYLLKAGATPAAKPTPTPPAPTPAATPAAAAVNKDGKVPVAKAEDERTAFDLELTKKLENGHSPGLQLAYSSEQDYTSMGLALKDAIDFNKKNTTVTLGGAYTHDLVQGFNFSGEKKKDTVEGILGLTQVLNRDTLLTLNLQLGHLDGYLSDPYKVAELNGVLVPEKRPDTKDRQVLYLALTHFYPEADGSLEASYRYYTDSFGIQANTLGLAWYQKLGDQFVLRPALRYYQQSAADFYGVSFTGSPEFYSADYRVSELDSWGYGLKLIWKPSDRFAADIAVDRYVQDGKDSMTSSDAYPAATMVIFGVRIWL